MADAVVELSNDADLVAKAAGGDPAAFDALYRQHGGHAWRLAQALDRDAKAASAAVAEAFGRTFDAARNGTHATDEPFRDQLLIATRNATVDAARAARARGEEARPQTDPESNLLTRAFTGLPERWRAVLWLTEVEGLRAHDAGPLVGLSPSGAAQVITRARAGLRQRYLQAHTLSLTERECSRAASHLGAYLADTAAPRDAANVERHLVACASCRDRVAEIDDAAARLGAIALPVPAALGDEAKERWATAVGIKKQSALALVVPGAQSLPRWAQRGLIGAAAASVAAGVLAMTLMSGRDLTRPARQLAVPVGRVDSALDSGAGLGGLSDPDLPAGSAIGVPGRGASLSRDGSTFSFGGGSSAADALGGVDRPRSSNAPTPRTEGPAGPGNNGGGDDESPVTPPGSGPINVGTDVGGVPVGVGVDPGSGSGGAQVGPVVVGDPPPAAPPAEEEPVIDLGDVVDQLPIDLPGLP